MAKQQYNLKMYGYISEHAKAKTSDAKRVRFFQDDDKQFCVVPKSDGSVCVMHNKTAFKLYPHKTIENLFTGEHNGTKYHFTKKKIVGKIVYWA